MPRKADEGQRQAAQRAGLAAPDVAEFVRRPIDWERVEDQPPADRQWLSKGWLGRKQTALLAGAGGIGKSLLGQQIGSELCLGINGVLPSEGRELTVLGWFSEDEEDELGRRQIRIAQHAGRNVSDFHDRLIVESFIDRDATLAERIGGVFSPTPLLDELRAQVNDYRADLVLLDNVARIFGGDENNRHDVTRYCAWLRAAVGDAALLLFAHPSRAAGSEWSGSTAWEAAVRSRWYMGRRLPDDRAGSADDDSGGGDDDTTRWLCRRKANYSGRDYVRLEYRDGVFVPDRPEGEADGSLMRGLRAKRASRVVVDGFLAITKTGKTASDAPSSQNYLPKLLLQMGLAESCTKQELADALNAAMLDGTFKRGLVGQYANRSPREGLVLIEATV